MKAPQPGLLFYMARDPAFLFYSSDFLTGVSDLTMEERGVYITLLCLQHQKGHLTEKMMRLCHGIISADVLAKFSLDENGNYYSQRLDVEIEKRSEFSKKQQKRAKDGWEKRKQVKNTDAAASDTAMPRQCLFENENENENIDVVKVNYLEVHQNFANRLLENDLEMQSIFEVSEKRVTLELLNKFNSHLINKSKEYNHYSQWKNHFSNWMNAYNPAKSEKSKTDQIIDNNAEAKRLLNQKP